MIRWKPNAIPVFSGILNRCFHDRFQSMCDPPCPVAYPKKETREKKVEVRAGMQADENHQNNSRHNVSEVKDVVVDTSQLRQSGDDHDRYDDDTSNGSSREDEPAVRKALNALCPGQIWVVRVELLHDGFDVRNRNPSGQKRLGSNNQ